jgi:hypothetical protein
MPLQGRFWRNHAVQAFILCAFASSRIAGLAKSMWALIAFAAH